MSEVFLYLGIGFGLFFIYILAMLISDFRKGKGSGETPVSQVEITPPQRTPLGPVFAIRAFVARIRDPQSEDGKAARTGLAAGLKAFLVVMIVGAVGISPTFAQSVDIDFSAADLDVFFQFFNLIFNALLRIGLVGAGLTAGAAFVWVVANMLTRAFTSLLGRGTARA